MKKWLVKPFEDVSTKRNTYNMTYNFPILLLIIVSPNTFTNKVLAFSNDFMS